MSTQDQAKKSDVCAAASECRIRNNNVSPAPELAIHILEISKKSEKYEPQNINVPISGINVPSFYVSTIPDVTMQIYAQFGIKYVHVRAKGGDYYVYKDALAAVVDSLNLYL